MLSCLHSHGLLMRNASIVFCSTDFRSMASVERLLLDFCVRLFRMRLFPCIVLCYCIADLLLEPSAGRKSRVLRHSWTRLYSSLPSTSAGAASSTWACTAANRTTRRASTTLWSVPLAA